MTATWFTARYAGHCAECRAELGVGYTVALVPPNRATRAKRVLCHTCGRRYDAYRAALEARRRELSHAARCTQPPDD